MNRVQEEIDVHTDQLENKRFRPTEAVVWKYFYSNGAEAPEEEDLAELSETALYERFVCTFEFIIPYDFTSFQA